MQTAVNYLTGSAVGIDFSWYNSCGNIFSNPYGSQSYLPQTYIFGQNLNNNIFGNSKSNVINFGATQSSQQYYEFGTAIASKPVGTKNNTVKKDTKRSETAKAKTNVPQKTVAQSNNVKQQAVTYADLRQSFVTTADKYLGQNEIKGDHKKFCINSGCNSFNEGEWCTDFVTYVVKESYKKNGLKAPYWFGDHDVATLKREADKHGKFNSIVKVEDKKDFITKNVKPGDIFILNEGGDSHTGFVTSVDASGGFYSIEGNRNDKVMKYYYSPDYKGLSGFIQLS